VQQPNVVPGLGQASLRETRRNTRRRLAVAPLFTDDSVSVAPHGAQHAAAVHRT